VVPILEQIPLGTITAQPARPHAEEPHHLVGCLSVLFHQLHREPLAVEGNAAAP
jgi:hypothetical protein